jgi:hypothetical protein
MTMTNTRNRNLRILQQWIELIKEAIAEGEDIRVNHRYSYKGKNLGTFLVGIKKTNDEESIKLLQEIGFDINKNSRVPHHFAQRFAEELLTNQKKTKTNFQTIFNKSILTKKDVLPQEIIDVINANWKTRFNEERSWEKPLTTIDKIILWKEFRYNSELNPEKKWYLSVKQVGNLYYWIRNYYIGKNDINSVIGVFNEKEKRELAKEGFSVELKKKVKH